MLLNPLVIVAALVAVLLLGVVLTWAGLRPRRRGTTPYCRACGYNMTGNTDGRCPECGSLRGVVLGERRVRKARLATGVVLLLISATGLGGIGYALVTNFNWYPYAPMWVLAYVFEDADPVEERLVGAEFSRRFKIGELDGNRASPLVGLIVDDKRGANLSEQKIRAIWSLVNNLDEIRRLSDADIDRLTAHIAKVLAPALELRPVNYCGAPVPARIASRIDRVNPCLFLWIAHIEIESIDVAGLSQAGSVVRRAERVLERLSPSSDTLLLEPSPVCGTQAVRLGLTVRFYRRSADSVGATSPAAAFRVVRKELSAAFEVIPAGEADLVSLKKSRKLDETIRSSASLTRCRQKVNWLGAPMFAGVLAIDRGVPVDLSFDGILIVGGVEILFGPFALQAGTGDADVTNWGTYRDGYTRNWYSRSNNRSSDENLVKFLLDLPLPAADPQRIDLVLRTNPEAAMQTVDMVEIWDGEIRFDDVLKNYAE